MDLPWERYLRGKSETRWNHGKQYCRQFLATPGFLVAARSKRSLCSYPQSDWFNWEMGTGSEAVLFGSYSAIVSPS